MAVGVGIEAKKSLREVYGLYFLQVVHDSFRSFPVLYTIGFAVALSLVYMYLNCRCLLTRDRKLLLLMYMY